MDCKTIMMHAGGIALSCGFTQSIAVPGAAISGIVAGVYKLSAKIYKKKADNIDPKTATSAEILKKKKWQQKYYDCSKTETYAKHAAASFLLAGVPVGGYMLAMIPWIMAGE